MGKIQIRIDDTLKKVSSDILNDLGLDLSSAIRLFLKKVVVTNGLPFDSRIDSQDYKYALAIRNMQIDAEDAGLSKLTLDEINEIIKEVRRERHEKEEKETGEPISK